MLDLVVDRREMKAVIVKALRFMGAKGTSPASLPQPRTVEPEVATEPVTRS